MRYFWTDKEWFGATAKGSFEVCAHDSGFDYEEGKEGVR